MYRRNTHYKVQGANLCVGGCQAVPRTSQGPEISKILGSSRITWVLCPQHSWDLQKTLGPSASAGHLPFHFYSWGPQHSWDLQKTLGPSASPGHQPFQFDTWASLRLGTNLFIVTPELSGIGQNMNSHRHSIKM